MTPPDNLNNAAADERPLLVGRSSSHFTRVVRLFAAECSVAYDFQVVPSLLAEDASAYGGNPGLRLPNLVTKAGPVFGSLNCCRALAVLAKQAPRMIWPEHTPSFLASNALELTLQAMSTEVTWVMLAGSGQEATPYAAKLRRALDGMLSWLEHSLVNAIGALPERDLSYLELTLFCLIEHLEFRNVTPLTALPNLLQFREQFGARRSAITTSFRFDS